MPWKRATGSAGGSAIVDFPAEEDVTHYVDAIVASYTGLGNGSLVVEDVDGEGVLLDVTIPGANTPVVIPLLFSGTSGKELKVSLTGIVGLTPKLNCLYHDF